MAPYSVRQAKRTWKVQINARAKCGANRSMGLSASAVQWAKHGITLTAIRANRVCCKPMAGWACRSSAHIGRNYL